MSKQQFRRSITSCSDVRDFIIFLLFTPGGVSDPKVSYDSRTKTGEKQNIARLDISVDDSMFMNMCQTTEDITDNTESSPLGRD